MTSHFRLLMTSILAILTACEQGAAQPIPVNSRSVAPGVVHREYQLPGPMTVDVVEVTRGNPLIRLESYRPDGLVKTTVQATANDRAGHRVIGAINADFFSFETGWPVGNQVVKGTFALGLSSNRSHLAIDSAGRPYIERLAFSGGVRTASGTSFALAGVNTSRTNGTMVFFTSFKGSSTGTDGTGTECAIEFITPTITAGDTLKARVIARSSSGNMAIPAHGGVLSGGSGSPASFLGAHVAVGDTIVVFLGFNRPLSHICEVLGGAGRILMSGRNVTDSMAAHEGIGSSFTDARHPRTFFGFSSDTSKLFLCTVDGRQATSVGMTFDEMAAFLASIGVSHAFNFDGGGSTTMVVRGTIVNSPSDPAGERSVANSLHVISTAPTGTLSLLDLQPSRAYVFQEGQIQFAASGTDEFFNPIPLPAGIQWGADPAIGTISSSGLFTAGKANDSGWVYIRWNDVADSAFVVVRLLSALYPSPSSIIMLPGERVALKLRGLDSRGILVPIPPSHVSIQPSNGAITADATGLITATDFGAGFITISLDTLRSVIPFSCSDRDTSIIVDPMQSLLFWDVTRFRCDTNQVTVVPSTDLPGSTVIRIGFNAPAPAAIVLGCGHVLAGRTDSIFVRVFGSANGDTLRLLLEDKDGELFWVPAPATVTWNNEWRTVGFALTKAVGGTGLDYPVTITGIRVGFGTLTAGGGNSQGTLYVEGLGAHYPVRVVTPQILFDFETGISGWLTPSGTNAAQIIGVNRTASTLAASAEKSYQGTFSGKWTYVDDPAISDDWDIRIPRSADLGSILRGSYIGAWVYAAGETHTRLQLVVRGGDGNGQICAGPEFPVRHYGWKLIGSKLDESLFTPYLTQGVITDRGNKFNGFRLRATNSQVTGQSRVLFIDKLVTNALTVPTGFSAWSAEWNAPLARLHWSVNSEISVNRYVIEREGGSGFGPIGALQAFGTTDTTRHYEYVDTPAPGGIIRYRLRQITNDGAQEVSPVIEVNTGTSIVSPEGSIIDRFELFQNYPNPFNPTTVVSGQWPVASEVTLLVYDVLGREVARLADGRHAAGRHLFVFDAAGLASGTYICRLQAVSIDGSRSFRQFRKMLVLK